MKNMNKKILSILLLSLLATPNVFAAYGADSAVNIGTTDDADDKQTVSIQIPEVALFDINDTDVNLNESGLIAPTNAGLGFTGTAIGSSTYAISSNIDNLLPVTRKISVAIDTAVGKVPAGAQLAVTVTAPTGGATGTATLTNSTTTAQDSATTIGNTLGTGLNIAYVLSTDPAGTGMIAHTSSQGTASDNIGLIYTLSDD